MATLTYQAQLEQVQAAITAVMSGQSYSIGGRSMTRADLAQLREDDKYLRMMAAREARNSRGIRVRGGTPANPR